MDLDSLRTDGTVAPPPPLLFGDRRFNQVELYV